MQLQRKNPQGPAGLSQPPKRDKDDIPVICSEQCNITFFNAQAIGKIPELCSEESSFLSDYATCKACVDNNRVEKGPPPPPPPHSPPPSPPPKPPTPPPKKPKPKEIPQFKPYLDYCATQSTETTQTPTATPTISLPGPVTPSTTSQPTSFTTSQNTETIPKTIIATTFSTTILTPTSSPTTSKDTLHLTFKVPIPLSSHHILSPPTPSTLSPQKNYTWIAGVIAGTIIAVLIILGSLFHIQRRRQKKNSALARARARAVTYSEPVSPGSEDIDEKDGGGYIGLIGLKPQLHGDSLVRCELPTKFHDAMPEMQAREPVGSELCSPVGSEFSSCSPISREKET